MEPMVCFMCREVGDAVVQKETAAIASEDVPADRSVPTKDRSHSSSPSSGTRSPVRMRSMEREDQRSRSGSRSSRSRSRSRSSSARSSRSGSNERRSRSPSREGKRVPGDDVIGSVAARLQSNEPQHSSSDEDDNQHQPGKATKEVWVLIYLIFIKLFSAAENMCVFCILYTLPVHQE